MNLTAVKGGKPGPLNTTDLFASNNPWGFPTVGNDGHIEPPQLWPYNINTGRSPAVQQAAVHFYFDDGQFESAWSNPRRALLYVTRFRWAITPAFSICSHWPTSLQLFNTYRSRWVGAYWRQYNQMVIPAVRWAGPASLQFAFDGIKRGSTVAISTVGVKGTEATKDHVRGLEAMLATVQPSNVLCYGRMLYDTGHMLGDIGIPVTEYPTYWEMKRAGQFEGSSSKLARLRERS